MKTPFEASPFKVFGFMFTHESMEYLFSVGMAFGLLYLFKKSGLRYKKIQLKRPKPKDYQREVIYSFITLLIFSAWGFVSLYLLKDYNKVYYKISDMPLWYFPLSILMMILLHDLYFYIMHWMMHQPKLFKYVHLIHHKSTNPTPWTSYSFHPIEGFLEGAIFPLIVFTMPVHFGAIGIFLLFQILYTVYGHIGYELYPPNFHTHWFGRWLNTSVAHNRHHNDFDGNYGLYTLIWDRLFKTIREDYNEDFKEVTERIKPS